MNRIVEGVLGSGKSYYCMNYVLKFADYDKLYRRYLLKPGYLLISNIDKLQVDHLNLDDCIKRFTLEKFLTVDNFEVLRKKYNAQHIILIIDEAQTYLEYKYYNKDVIFFFEYARHLGVDIFLIAPSASSICKQVTTTCEYIIKALERSKHIPGTFRYQFHDRRYNYLDITETIKHSDYVFNSYRSFTSNELTKPKSTYIKPLIYLSVAVVATVIMLSVFLGRWTHPASAKSIAVKTNTVDTRSSRAAQWHKQYSSAQNPVITSSPPPIHPGQIYVDVPRYVMVDITGYSSGSSRRVYLLSDGQVLPSSKVKDFDRLSMTAYVLSSDLRGGHVSTSPPLGGAAAALPAPPKSGGFSISKPDVATGPSGSGTLVAPGQPLNQTQIAENR